ncbi:MAG: hypothetical protein EAY75_16455 [Bacteroidetes bacterium]|nr:MAG: hypothetical protein EAY75_16455 [Bacteroidota bacterium]
MYLKQTYQPVAIAQAFAALAFNLCVSFVLGVNNTNLPPVPMACLLGKFSLQLRQPVAIFNGAQLFL